MEGYLDRRGGAYVWHKEEGLRAARNFHSRRMPLSVAVLTSKKLGSRKTSEINKLLEMLCVDRGRPYAVYLSPEGPMQRGVVFRCSSSGESILKVAVGSAATSAVMRERDVYKHLDNLPPSTVTVPALLRHYSNSEYCANEFRFYPTTCLRRIELAELAPFLAELRNLAVAPQHSKYSFVMSARELRAELIRRGERAWDIRLAKLLRIWDSVPLEERPPPVFAHRDFARWNMLRSRANNIVVHDWEYAAFGKVSGHDEFHFRYMPKILSAGFAIPFWRHQFLRRILEVPSAVTIGYFLDIADQYVRAEISREDYTAGSLVGGKVLQRIGVCIDAMGDSIG